MKNITYINAGAGSGKTHKLTTILTDLIKSEKVKPEQVILTTFTTKAANEFKEKAKAFLFQEGLYEEALRLDHAMIGTVHSVCQRMIGKYWFNLGLTPNMGVMAEEDTAYYISQSLADLPTEEELKTLHAFAKEFDLREADGFKVKATIDYDFWQKHLKKVIELATNYELNDFAESENQSLKFIHQFVKTNGNYNYTYQELKDLVDEHETFLRNRKQSDANDARIEKLVQSRRFLNNPTIGLLRNINSTIGTPKGYGPLAANFENQMANIWTSQMVFEKQESYIKLLFNLAKWWRENFAQFKRDKNLLDYNDMEKYMRQLMQNETVKSEIANSYHYLFVDEFQDSSPIQVKIFDALSDLMEHSYWVSDYKQAIYGFRGSDISLVKAVVDCISEKKNGCDTDRLPKCWRSLPDIVNVNNKIFEKTFANVLDKENIHLDEVRRNESNEDSLRYFISRRNGAGIAEHILKLLNQGAKPNEIAVLARTNATLADVASKLNSLKIPASREDLSVIETPVYPLVASLLRIVESSTDALAKATVALLTESDYSTRQIIEEKIINDSDVSADKVDFLNNVPLISQLLKIRDRLQQQSVASLVESLTIELNLYDIVKKLDIEPAFGISSLQTIISTARAYEEHSVQMNLPATIDGFISYIEQISPVGCGDSNGVQLHTYHSCKGLQWKYVILTSLNNKIADKNKSIKTEMYGVHAIHTNEPTAQSPYPDVFIRLTPFIYGANSNVPENICAIIEQTRSYNQAYNSIIEEANRLFYVGMTRPRDVLIIDLPDKGSMLQWPKDVGLSEAASSLPESGSCDLFGTGYQFHNFTLTDSEAESQQEYGDCDTTIGMSLKINTPSLEKRDPRYLSPSHIHAKGNLVSSHNFGKRISLAKQSSDMSIVGDCIHQIFAGIEEPHPSYDDWAKEIIRSYELSGILADTNDIVQAWKNLYEYLSATYGAAVKCYHERPFRLERNGQTIIGSIDLVWQTKDGDILVDFKTCPMGEKAVFDAESEHYAGWYAGQLDAYHDALEAAGEHVIKRYIYYPVSGLLAEISKA